jgi:beta-glucosidase
MRDSSPAADPAATVDDLLARLTRAEKLRLVRGGVDSAGRATGYVPGVERLGTSALAHAAIGLTGPGRPGADVDRGDRRVAR